MRRVAVCCFLALVGVWLTSSGSLLAADWPMWRYDAMRSAATPQPLPEKLELAWSRQLPKLVPAWTDQPKLQFDAAYEPVVAGKRLFVGSSHDDSVTAYSTETGQELWKFLAEGPVRFAPLAHRERVYAASDDGYLYCLAADSGNLVWKFRGGPSDRKVLGNERLISMWPLRGAPVLVDDTIYIAAGIWPFMGIFLHALDVQTGQVVWTNDGDGSMYIKQPHNSDSFAGVAPQGPLVAAGDKLLVPGGRSVPAGYDRLTGKFLYYQLAENGKRGGGYQVAATQALIFNGGGAFDLQTEKYLGDVGDLLVCDETSLVGHDDGRLSVKDLRSSEIKLVETLDRKGARTQVGKWSIKQTADARSPNLTALMKAGSQLYAGTAGSVLAMEMPSSEQKEATICWQQPIDGTPVSLVAADDKLLVSTLEGTLYCFAAPLGAAPKAWRLPDSAPEAAASEDSAEHVRAIIDATGVREGYGIVCGAADAGLIEQLAQQSKLTVIVLEPNAESAHVLRRRLAAQGIANRRVTVLVGSLSQTQLPQHLASLILDQDGQLESVIDNAALLGKTFDVLRPHGGMICLTRETAAKQQLTERVASAKLPNAQLRAAGAFTLLVREGALPGAANWTHEHADAANTRVSKDALVKAPLGLLWFGGPSNEQILPRHGHGPQPQVIDGRLFIEGVDMLRAVDIYTGRLLWQKELPGVGEFYNNTAHQPGANASGTNYIATHDGVYVAYRERCLRLDPATGDVMAEFMLPTATGDAPLPDWGYINVLDDYLIAAADPLFDPALNPKMARSKAAEDTQKSDGKSSSGDLVSSLVNKALKIDNDNYSSSKRLVVMNRHTGQVSWTADARSGFRHNALCAGGGRLYCIDRLSGSQVARLKRRGEDPPHKPRLVVFDLKTGSELWSTEVDVFGTWLSYSADFDVLVEAGRPASDTLKDEPRGMRAYQAAGGKVLWTNMSHAGPAMIQRDTILMAGKACELLTGEPKMREHPLSGELVEWSWSRNYGCNTPMASEHLLTFRSGAAGYFDLCNDGGTGNLGGFRSSCSNNLIVAGGLLNAPDYTRTCTCNYQNQTSLALVHMPEVEMWTSFGAQSPKQALRRLGLNLGAPGDRKADDGTLWLEFPSVGGNSPVVEATMEPADVGWFRRHASQISGEAPPWIAGSGATGVRTIRVKLDPQAQQMRTFTVRLYFCEPENVSPGQRRFDVALQGTKMLSSLDVAHEAGGMNRGLVKELAGIALQGELIVDLTPVDKTSLPPVLSGIEVQAEGW